VPPPTPSPVPSPTQTVLVNLPTDVAVETDVSAEHNREGKRAWVANANEPRLPGAGRKADVAAALGNDHCV